MSSGVHSWMLSTSLASLTHCQSSPTDRPPHSLADCELLF